MASKIPRLNRSTASAIDRAVDNVFDSLKLRFLGPGAVGDKRLFIGFLRERSLSGIFEDAVREEGGVPDTGLLDHLIEVTGDYIEQHRSAAKALVKRRVQEALHNVSTGNMKREDVANALEAEIQSIWATITAGVRKVVETETEHAKTLGVKDAIDQINGRMGIEDPVICFIPVRDNSLCEECIRLHLFRDSSGTYIPRVWKSSEVKAEFHHKGDPTPSWSKLHPHCRCELTTVLPGYGFNEAGHLTFKTEDHDEWARQRGLEERYLSRYGKLRKSTREGLKTFEALRSQWDNTPEPWASPYHTGSGSYKYRLSNERFHDYWRGRMNRFASENWDQDRQREWFDAVGLLDTNADWKPAEEFIQKYFPDYKPWKYEDRPLPKFVEAIKNAPITLNFPTAHLKSLLKDGRYKNLFETGEGEGETDKSVRSEFENNVFGINEDVPAKERPVYGALNVHAAWNREHEHRGGASGYGSCWLELKPHVKERSTFTPDDSFLCQADHVFTMKHPEAIAWFASRLNSPLWELHHEHGTTEDRHHCYIESQIHGGIYMKDDVASIHLGPDPDVGNARDWAPENLATEKPFENIANRQAVALGRKYGIPVHLHLKVKDANNGPRAEYKTVLLYHPAFDTTKPKKPRKQAVPKEQASLFKSTPAGLVHYENLKGVTESNAANERKQFFQHSQELLKHAHSIPLQVHVPAHAFVGIARDGRLKNQFDTRTSMGTNDTDIRKHHEERVLGIPKTAGAHERPVYGTMNFYHGLHDVESAMGGASHYGDMYLELKPHVKERSTFTPSDSFSVGPDAVFSAGGLDAMIAQSVRNDHGYLDNTLKNHFFNGEPVPEEPRRWGSYMEAQIHGGVYLNRDVAAIHFSPRYRGGTSLQRATYPRDDDGLFDGGAFRTPHEIAVEVGKKYGIPVYWHRRVHSDGTPYTVGDVTSGTRIQTDVLHHPDQTPEVAKEEEYGAYGLPLMKAANWSLKDFDRLVGEFGWYPAGNGGSHKLYAHASIPFKLAVKHEHAHGNLTPYWVKKYAKDIGLNIGYTGQSMVADPKHPYAEHYRRTGHLPPDTKTPPPMKTYQPASEHHEVVDINKLKAMRQPMQAWKVLKYQASMGRNMPLHPITVAKNPDGDYTVLRGHHLLTAAKAAGLTHVPVRHG